MSLVDANIVLRYVLDGHPELSPKAADIFERQAVTWPIEATCEVVYVLQKVYAVARQDIQQQLCRLLDENLVSLDKPAVFFKALECYSTNLRRCGCLAVGLSRGRRASGLHVRR